ncbi:MAG: hypothetical protein FWF10_02485 [Clostridiales bacterium]|nr:hypothetical protein [Clostridiales bacterium]
MPKKKRQIDLRALRWIFGSVLVVVLAIAAPIFIKQCEKPPAVAPPAYAPLFAANWERAFAAQGMECRDGEIYDSRYECRAADILNETDGALLTAGTLHIPFVIFDGAPDPESDAEFARFLQAEKSQNIMERMLLALHTFADTGETPPRPAPAALLYELAETMRRGTPYEWTWNNLRFSAERKTDMAGNTVLALAFYVIAETAEGE